MTLDRPFGDFNFRNRFYAFNLKKNKFFFDFKKLKKTLNFFCLKTKNKNQIFQKLSKLK